MVERVMHMAIKKVTFDVRGYTFVLFSSKEVRWASSFYRIQLLPLASQDCLLSFSSEDRATRTNKSTERLN